jgi:hypothetical protein
MSFSVATCCSLVDFQLFGKLLKMILWNRLKVWFEVIEAKKKFKTAIHCNFKKNANQVCTTGNSDQ